MPNDIVAKCFCVDQLSWIGCEPQLSVVPNVLNKTVFHVMKGQSSISVLSCIAELSNEPYEGFVSTDCDRLTRSLRRWMAKGSTGESQLSP